MKKFWCFLLCMSTTLRASDALDMLAHAFQDIEDNYSLGNYPLLGPQLLKKYGDAVIIDSDLKRNIYQIKVINQTDIEGGESHCAFNAPRNGLYIAEMIESPFADFKKLYGDMLNADKVKDWIEAYQKANGEECSLNASGYAPTPFELKEMFEYKNDIFPKNQLATEILTYGFMPQGIENDYADIIKKCEGDKDKNKINKKVLDSSVFKSAGDGIAEFLESKKNKNYINVLMLIVAAVGNEHGITFVVHKYNNSMEFFVADSWYNSRFSISYKGNTKMFIDSLVTFYSASDQEFNEIRTRSECLSFYMSLKGAIEEADFRKILNSARIFFQYTKKLSFFDENFYKKYYMNVIKELMKKIDVKFIKNEIQKIEDKDEKERFLQDLKDFKEFL